MEPQNILPDYVQVGGPERRQSGVLISAAVPTVDDVVVDPQSVHPREIIRQRVEPHIHDVIRIEPLRKRNPVREGRTTDAQVPQSIGSQSGEYRVPLTIRTDEVDVRLDVLDESVVVLPHPEEVTRLLHPLEGLAGRRVAVVAKLGLGVRDERLLLDVVPPRVIVEIYVVVGRAAKPQGLGRALVPIGGGADVIVVGDEDALVEASEAGDVLMICFFGGVEGGVAFGSRFPSVRNGGMRPRVFHPRKEGGKRMRGACGERVRCCF